MIYMSGTAKERKGRKRIPLVMRNVGFAILAFFCGFQSIASSGGAWPTYHGDASLKGVSAAELPEKPELRWRFNAGAEIYSTPVSDGERIFFAARKGRLLAVDLQGKQLWEQPFSRTNDANQAMAVRFEAPLVCADGTLFAGTTHGILYALDSKTGREKWRYDTEGIIIGSPNFIGSPAAAGGRKLVVLDQNAGVLHCVDMTTGKRLWTSEAVERCDGAPGTGNGRIVFGSCLSALHVYADSGNHLMDIEVGGDSQIAGGVAVDGDAAFAGVRDGGMLRFDLKMGEVAWSSDESEQQTFSTPAVTEELVVYTSDDGYVYAVTKCCGSLVWKTGVDGSPYSPAVAGDKVAAVSDGILYLLDLNNGRILWSKEVSDDITSPAIIGSMIVVGGDDGTVTAWGSSATGK